MVVRCSYFLPLWVGWPTLAVVFLLVITWVPWRPCQEFRSGCYPSQYVYRGWMDTMAWWWCLMPLVRSSIPWSKVLGRMWRNSKCALVTADSDTPVRVHRKDSTEAFRGDETRFISMRAWTPNIGTCWPTKWLVNTPLATPTCSLQPRSWRDVQKPEILCSWRLPQLEDQT